MLSISNDLYSPKEMSTLDNCINATFINKKTYPQTRLMHNSVDNYYLPTEKHFLFDLQKVL